ncbi:thiolase family protein [Cloacibacillus evryensis]|uniref:Thiolase family protein n=1 Tax=Cloacibacillus evryensis TaxID=508460 RepID=A0AAW5K225_9BACT|nr:thiolase family protein [Cloacibacillus evryensis]EHL70058.1 acetyl-CoA C-acetyltransferase [Synergistes sp. 3_1_syn1]MCQ4765391.1 thiolase family protein [Cloacibacillus evryensis]MCQ4814880.1 thiolase family protein [Cloacibacillus evryensis]
MKEVYVVSAARTPLGSIGGTLKNTQPEELLRVALEGAVSKAGIGKEIIDEVICGQAKQTTDAPNIARIVSLMMQIPEATPAYTVHRQCASGMQAILSGMQQIQCGYSDVVLTGGVESMSTAPFYIRNARFGVGNGNGVFVDPNIESQPKSQPNDIYGTFSMIQTADNVARQFGVSREAQDEFALASQTKAIAAIDSGRFKDEIVPVIIPQRKKEPTIFDTDEFPKRGTNMEKLSKLKTIFPEGFVTAGNASGRNDGAAAVLVASKEKVEELGLKPMARIIAGCAAGVDPRIMGMGPVAATRKLMKMIEPQNLKLDDFGLVELNEAFAAQSVACVNELGLNPETVNVNGGAIALGHPLGCSGARISTTLLYEMQKRDVRYGLATICIAGGLGMAMAFEKI